MAALADSLKTIHQRIKTAAIAAGRNPSSITLLAVSKGKPQSDVEAALKAGHRLFGENRVQEAKAKFTSLRSTYPDLKLHLIGPLQTNKAEEAVKLFDVIETLDRKPLADALAKAVKKTSRAPKFYIEINSGREAQKAGIAPADLDSFLRYCREACGLAIDGLMCIPPQKDDAKIHFLQLKDLAVRHGLATLSMGMSADFEMAIACGSTEVRIGTAIFGARSNSPN